MNVASKALDKEMPEPMKHKILFLKLSEAQPSEYRIEEPWLDSVGNSAPLQILLGCICNWNYILGFFP